MDLIYPEGRKYAMLSSTMRMNVSKPVLAGAGRLISIENQRNAIVILPRQHVRNFILTRMLTTTRSGLAVSGCIICKSRGLGQYELGNARGNID